MTDLLSGGRRFGACRGVLPLLLGLVLVGVAVAQPSRVLILEHIDVLPADQDTRNLVLRYVPIAAGDVVDGAILGEVRNDLEGSGWFREVILYTSRGQEPGGIVLHVEVVLDRKLRFLTGFGHEPLDGWYLSLIGVSLRNRPRAGAEWRLASRDGYFTDGWFLEGRMCAGRDGRNGRLFELSAQRRTWFAYEGREEWRQEVRHFALRLGREFGFTPRGMLVVWLAYRGVDPDEELHAYFDEEEWERPTTDLVDAVIEARNFADVWLEGRWDGRDQVRPWRQGSWLGGRLHLAQELPGHWYYSLEADGRHTVALGAVGALAGRVRLGHVSPRAPYYDRFQFGGASTIRGYDMNFLGGALGAANLVQANLEYRLALMGGATPTPRLSGVLFLDTGQSWERGGATRGWAVGVGGGFRLRLPWVKLVGVEVGYPLVVEGDMSPFVVNMALGWSY